MITSSGDQEKTRAIEAGADDFINKPFHQGELLARVASLARIKRYHDTVTQQAAELVQWNAELEARVEAQLEELRHRLRWFLSPSVTCARRYPPVPQPAIPDLRVYDGASGRFLLPGGEQRHLVATDHLESHELRALAVDDLFDIVARHGLHFDQSRQTGVFFHMISSLTEHGRMGVTAVGQSPRGNAQYEEARQVLLTEAAAARGKQAD